MAAEPIIIVSAGGLGRETLAAVRAAGTQHPMGFLDDNDELHGSAIDGVEVLGGVATVANFPDVRLVVCAGHGRTRQGIVDRLTDHGVYRDRYTTVVHPGASVLPAVQLGVGTILLAGVVLTAGVIVGDHCVAMPNAVLTHDVVLGDFVTLCAGVTLGGSVVIGSGAYVGMNVSVRQGLRIGSWVTIGMGAALLADVPSGQTWFGVPASPRRHRSEIETRVSASERI